MQCVTISTVSVNHRILLIWVPTKLSTEAALLLLCKNQHKLVCGGCGGTTGVFWVHWLGYVQSSCHLQQSHQHRWVCHVCVSLHQQMHRGHQPGASLDLSFQEYSCSHKGNIVTSTNCAEAGLAFLMAYMGRYCKFNISVFMSPSMHHWYYQSPSISQLLSTIAALRDGN